MVEHMEDEEKIASDEDLAHAKEGDMPKKPSDKDLIEAYIEDREDEEKERWPEEKKK